MEIDKTVPVGCYGYLRFTYTNDGKYPSDLTVGFYINAFYVFQRTFWDKLKVRLNLIWCGLSGKEFQLYDVPLFGSDLEIFKKEIKDLVDKM